MKIDETAAANGLHEERCLTPIQRLFALPVEHVHRSRLREQRIGDPDDVQLGTRQTDERGGVAQGM